jgi:hypothetical protein
MHQNWLKNETPIYLPNMQNFRLLFELKQLFSYGPSIICKEHKTAFNVWIKNKKVKILKFPHFCPNYVKTGRRVAPYTPTRSCVHIGVLKKK